MNVRPHGKIAKFIWNSSMETISRTRSFCQIFDQSDEQRRHLCKSILSHAFILLLIGSHTQQLISSYDSKWFILSFCIWKSKVEKTMFGTQNEFCMNYRKTVWKTAEESIVAKICVFVCDLIIDVQTALDTVNCYRSKVPDFENFTLNISKRHMIKW